MLAFVQGLELPESSKVIVIVGPEAPLEAGVVDALEAQKIDVVGPRQRLAMLETSKNFTRELMHKYMIPGRCKCAPTGSHFQLTNVCPQAQAFRLDGRCAGVHLE